MPIPQFAKRTLAALALTALAAGCGGDSTGPGAPFDPEGTSADLGAMQASFDSPAMEGFASASDAMSAVLGAAPASAAVRVAPTRSLMMGARSAAKHYGAVVAKAYVRPAGGIQPSLAVAGVPEELLGVTFVYNTETDAYEASELAGAPDDGVRFLVYAVNPINGMPIEPLIEAGYADLTTTESASAVTVRVELVSAGVTYLDYSVGATGSASAITVAVSGFVSNGDDRVNFDLDNHLTAESMGLDYTLVVPTRGGFRIDFEGDATDGTVTSSIEARGPHGTVMVSGSQNATGGSFDVRVNGELFATLTVTTGEPPVITGADGQALSPAELHALQAMYGLFVEGFDFFEDLLDPLG